MESQPLVSILIPSRKRLERLARTLESIHQTATGLDYEILIAFDDDDSESVKAVPSLETGHNTRCFVGPRLGYSELDIGYFAGLERKGTGLWSWVGGDDMIVEGDWFGELSKVPTHGFIVQPAISKLGGSTYPMAEDQAFPIFPRFAWKEVSETFPRPMDTHGCIMLKASGWKTRFLPGVSFWHDRPPESEIQVHRKM